MDQSLIAQKLRELADLFDQQVAPKAEPKAVKETKAVKIEPAAAPMDVAAAAAAAPTLDDLRQGMAELIGAGKRDKVIAILANLGVKKVSDIEDDKFAEAMGLINGAR